MRTPAEIAEDIAALYDGTQNEAVASIVRESMQHLYEDIADFIADEYMDEEGISDGIRLRMTDFLGDEEDYY